MALPREQGRCELRTAPAWFPLSGSGWQVGLTLHRILHILSKEVPHHLSTDLPHVQLLGEPGVRGECESQNHLGHKRPPRSLSPACE